MGLEIHCCGVMYGFGNLWVWGDVWVWKFMGVGLFMFLEIYCVRLYVLCSEILWGSQVL